MTKPKSHLACRVITLFSRQRYEKKIKEKPIKMFFVDKNINISYFTAFSTNPLLARTCSLCLPLSRAFGSLWELQVP